MIISFIVAVDEQNGMGIENHLPWKLPKDFKMFRETTTGHHILMGRKTYESLGAPLPNRTNIIITKDAHYPTDGIVVKQSIDDGIAFAKNAGETELFIIGGAEIFKQTMHLASKIYLTRVHHTFAVDTYFPMLDNDQWHIVKSEFNLADEKNKYDFTFKTLERTI